MYVRHVGQDMGMYLFNMRGKIAGVIQCILSTTIVVMVVSFWAAGIMVWVTSVYKLVGREQCMKDITSGVLVECPVIWAQLLGLAEQVVLVFQAVTDVATERGHVVAGMEAVAAIVLWELDKVVLMEEG
jgi:hypothetical protein